MRNRRFPGLAVAAAAVALAEPSLATTNAVDYRNYLRKVAEVITPSTVAMPFPKS